MMINTQQKHLCIHSTHSTFQNSIAPPCDQWSNRLGTVCCRAKNFLFGIHRYVPPDVGPNGPKPGERNAANRQIEAARPRRRLKPFEVSDSTAEMGEPTGAAQAWGEM